MSIEPRDLTQFPIVGTPGIICGPEWSSGPGSTIERQLCASINVIAPRRQPGQVFYLMFTKVWGSLMQPDEKEIRTGVGRRSLYRGEIAVIGIKIGREVVEGTSDLIRDTLAGLWIEGSISLRNFVEKKTQTDHSVLTDVVRAGVARFLADPPEVSEPDHENTYRAGVEFVERSLARGRISQDAADHFLAELGRQRHNT